MDLDDIPDGVKWKIATRVFQSFFSGYGLVFRQMRNLLNMWKRHYGLRKEKK